MKTPLRLPSYTIRNACATSHHNSKLKRSFCTDASTEQIRNQFYSKICTPFTNIIEIKHISDRPIPQLKGRRKRSQQPTISKGRGVFAKKNIQKGEIVTQESPFSFSVDPPVDEVTFREKFCQHCLTPIPSKSIIECEKCNCKYCSPKCKDESYQQYHEVLCSKEVDLTPLNKYCEENGRLFPLIVARIYARILLGVKYKESFEDTWDILQTLQYGKPVQVNEEDENEDGLEEPVDSTGFAPEEEFYRLTKADMFLTEDDSEEMEMERILNDFQLQGGQSSSSSTPPPYWRFDYELFSQLLLSKSDTNAKFFSYEWFAKVMQILQVNALNMDIDYPTKEISPILLFSKVPPSRTKRPTTSGPITPLRMGTGLFLLTSFYNHSCVPNTSVNFQGNNVVKIQANTDIKKGDELTINYIDPTQPATNRRSFLHQHYGFWCFCPKCTMEIKASSGSKSKPKSKRVTLK